MIFGKRGVVRRQIDRMALRAKIRLVLSGRTLGPHEVQSFGANKIFKDQHPIAVELCTTGSIVAALRYPVQIQVDDVFKMHAIRPE